MTPPPAQKLSPIVIGLLNYVPAGPVDGGESKTDS